MWRGVALINRINNVNNNNSNRINNIKREAPGQYGIWSASNAESGRISKWKPMSMAILYTGA